MKKYEFEKRVENMIDPIDVGTVHFMQQYGKYVPKKVMSKVLKNGASKNPYMGFVVEPYSLFLCYEIVDVEYATRLLPDNYELVKTKVFDDDEPKYYSVFGCFNVHTSSFWGVRMEFNIIARNKDSGLTSWVIIDYHTNTVSYDTKRGLIGGNTSECILTTNYDGDIILDIEGSNDGNRLTLNGSLVNGVRKRLGEKLWIDGNLSVGYGRDISSENEEAFSTMFKPNEVESALEIPITDINIEVNSWYAGLIESKPAKIVCFPFAQHYLSDSIGSYSHISGKDELISKIEGLDFDMIPRYSSKPIKKLFNISQTISTTLIIVLIILLVLK